MARSRSLLILVAVGALAGCSSAASSAPGTSTDGGGGGGPTQAPASQAAGGAGSSQDVTAGAAFGPAATALDSLDSYKFDVEITSSENGTFGAAGTTSFTGVVVNKPDKEQLLDQVARDAGGNVTSELHILVIGDRAWTRQTADGTYVELPAAGVTGMLAGLLAFQPAKLFGTAFGTLGSDYHLVGTESKNGVDAQHFHGDQSIGTFFSALSGTSGSWSSDVWLASDGGYLVSSSVAAAAADASSAGSFAIDVEITNVNDPGNAQQPPS
ncbi:MAG TPA: hypothetical protein VGI98_07010 [Candidatus Limnocylindrales bacterium]|jgi:hypothetical protein